MAKPKEKLKALRLRRRGNSIKTIADKLHVSKGSVSLWCQEIDLTVAQTKRLKENQIRAGHKGRIIGAEMNRKKKSDHIKQRIVDGRNTISSFSERDMLILGLGLYWGEGTKLGSGTTALVNSDPAVILCSMKWFESCLDVLKEDFRPYVYISETHKGRQRKILKFWSDYLSIPIEQFHDVIFLTGRPKKIYKNHDSYYGVLALRVRKGTDLKYRILGLIEACKEQMGIESE